MSDRKMIKWQPFNSLMNSKQVVKEIMQDKGKIAMPILSDDQLSILEEKIILAYESGMKVNIKYYKNGYLYLINTNVKSIDKTNRKVFIKNNQYLYFNTIVDIKL